MAINDPFGNESLKYSQTCVLKEKGNSPNPKTTRKNLCLVDGSRRISATKTSDPCTHRERILRLPYQRASDTGHVPPLRTLNLQLLHPPKMPRPEL